MNIIRCEYCDRPATGKLYEPPVFITLQDNPDVCDDCQAEMAEVQMDPDYTPRGRFLDLFGEDAR